MTYIVVIVYGMDKIQIVADTIKTTSAVNVKKVLFWITTIFVNKSKRTIFQPLMMARLMEIQQMEIQQMTIQQMAIQQMAIQHGITKLQVIKLMVMLLRTKHVLTSKTVLTAINKSVPNVNKDTDNNTTQENVFYLLLTVSKDAHYALQRNASLVLKDIHHRAGHHAKAVLICTLVTQKENAKLFRAIVLNSLGVYLV